MGVKHVCFSCRKAFNAPYGATGPERCPECGVAVVVLPHRFRPPKKRDAEKWAAVKYLVDQGFRYEHLNPMDFPIWARGRYGNYVRFPESVRGAKEFVEAYLEFSQKKK